MLDAAIDDAERACDRPVWQPIPDTVKDTLATPVPLQPQGMDKACEDLWAQALTYPPGNTHPRFWGWVHGAGAPGGIIADVMASAMNSNLGGRDHGANYVEHQIIKWMKKVFDFPHTASGLVVSGTSIATLIALTAARYVKTDYDVRRQGVRPEKGQFVGYTSTEAHSCIARTFDMLGLGLDALRPIPVGENYQMKTGALRQAIEKDLFDGNRPFCDVGSPATINTSAIGDLNAITDICQEHEPWYHIDGTFGAVTAMSDKLKPRFKGLERADSIAFDFHKWMHVQYDAGCVLIRREELHRESFTLRREYLTAAPRGLAAGNPWFCECGPELSRGFRALKVWFHLKEHGRQRILEKVEDTRGVLRRATLVDASLLLVVCALFASGLFRGSYPVDVIAILNSIAGTTDPITKMIVLDNRLSRLCIALGVGLAFGTAGEMIQTLPRNPLASPDVIGFSAGAGFGAVLTMALTGTAALVVPGAMLGGVIAAAIVIGLAWRGGIAPREIVLVGIRVTLTLSVMTNLAMSYLDVSSATSVLKWIVGTLDTRSWPQTQLLWMTLLVLLPLAYWNQFSLARVAMGTDRATSHGIRVTHSNLATLALAVTLVAIAVAAAGPLPFVAFVAGPIAHGLNGRSRPALVSAGLAWAAITLAADAATQMLPVGITLPAGIFTAMTGAPVLLAVLIFQSRKRTL